MAGPEISRLLMHRKWILLSAVAILAVGVLSWVAFRTKDDIELAGANQITVQLQWTPSAQFIGFYAAKTKGFYAQEGLSVKFLHGGASTNPIEPVVNGQAQI